MGKYNGIKHLGILIICALLPILVSAQQKRTVFDNGEYIVEPAVSVNTVASEISPVFVENSLFFSGVPSKYFDKLKRREKNNTAFYSVYTARVNNNGEITSTRSLVPGFGSDFHEGPAVFCESTGELFVTMSDANDPALIEENNSGEDVRLRLVIMKLLAGEWHIVDELPFNDRRFHFAHPAISTTGDTLIFSSDLDSVSYGNTDLFMSVRTSDGWSPPVNLGNEINTEGNEMFPTFIKGGLLSFASDGRADNTGGLDIYYTTFPDSGEIKNPGGQINSEFDDFGLVIYKNGDIGYFASNRNKTSSDDIFKLNINRLFYIMDGRIVNEVTNMPVPNVSLVFMNCSDTVVKKTFTDSLGNFSIEIPENKCLHLTASKEGYKTETKDVSHRNYVEFRLDQNRYYEIVTLDPGNMSPLEDVTIFCNDLDSVVTDENGLVVFELPLPENCSLKATKEDYLNISLSDNTIFRNVVTRDTVYLYKKELNKSYILSSNYSKWSILRDLENELNKLIAIMNINPDITIEIGFHTDSRGGDSYNEWLSQRHAEVAAKYIIDNGVDQSRIVGKGYGENQLINHCANGVNCTSEEHEKNRRVEFKIIGIKP